MRNSSAFSFREQPERSRSAFKALTLLVNILAPLPSMRESCDKNVIMPLRGEMAGWEKAKPEASRAGIFPAVGRRSCQR